MNLTLDVSKTTQYGSTFGVNSVSQDGFTTGRLIGINVDSTGVVQARFTNGRSTPLGQIAIANFANPQGLQAAGRHQLGRDLRFRPAAERPGGQLGLRPDPVRRAEQSNVDITAQLVNMITAQRNFQANAQMIATQDQITQTIINIR